MFREIDDAETLNFNDLAIKNSKGVGILGITLDENVNFLVEKQVKI